MSQFKQLLVNIKENKIPQLILDDKDLSDIKKIEELAEALKHNSSIIKISLRNTKLNDDCLEKLAPAFAENKTLQELDLSKNPFSLRGMKALTFHLKNTPLTVIDLSETQIGDSGVAAFSKFIGQNKTLVRLSLSNFENQEKIKISGIGYLCEALKAHPTIRYLDLTGNLLEDQGCENIADFLSVNQSIAFLNVSWNKISVSGAGKIAEALSKNHTLHSLEFRHNQIGSGAKYLLQAATNATKLPLYFIDISDNKISADAIEEVLSILGKNDRLCKLIIESIVKTTPLTESLNTGFSILWNNPNADEIFAEVFNRKNGQAPLAIKNINIKTRDNFQKQKNFLEPSLRKELEGINYSLVKLETVSAFDVNNLDLVHLFYRIDSEWVKACADKIYAERNVQEISEKTKEEDNNNLVSYQNPELTSSSMGKRIEENTSEIEYENFVQQQQSINFVILKILKSDETYHQFYESAKDKLSLLNFVIATCEKHVRWGELNKDFSQFTPQEIESILSEHIAQGINAWQVFNFPEGLMQDAESDRKDMKHLSSSTETASTSLKEEDGDRQPIVKTFLQQNLPKQARVASAKNFPVEALERLLDFAKLVNIKNLIENARSNRKSTLIKTISYLKDLGNDDSAMTRFLQAAPSEELWFLMKRLNWYRTSGLFCQKALDKLGFHQKVDWFSALGEELQDAYADYQEIDCFLKTFQNSSGTPNYDQMALVLLQDAALYDLLFRHKDQLIEIFAAAGIPGFDNKAAKTAINLLLSIQSKVINLQKNFDSLIALGTQLCHDETEQMGKWLQKIGRLTENLYLVIQAYTEPKNALMTDFIQADVMTLFRYAQQLLILPNKNELVFKNILVDDNTLRIDCKSLFSRYLDGRQGPLLSRVLSTSKADVIHALDLRGIRFVGSSSTNLYKFEKFGLQGFNFSNCCFTHCSFQQAAILDCKFEDTEFQGTLDLTDLLIDANSAKSFCLALKRSLDKRQMTIKGKMHLIGDFKGISLPISNEYYNAELAENFDFNLQEKSIDESQKPEAIDENKQAESSNVETEEQEEKQVAGYMESFYNGVKAIAENAPQISSSISASINYIGNVVANIGEKNFVASFEDDQDRLMLQIQKELHEKINELKQTEEELKKDTAVLKIQLIGVAKTQQQEKEILREKIKTLESALQPISHYWEEKQHIKQEREILETGKGESVAHYYQTLRSKLCAAFQAIFILQSGFIKREEGVFNNMKSKSSNVSTAASIASTTTGIASTVANNLGSIASAAGKASQFLGSACLKLFSSKITEVSNTVPGLGMITSTGKMIADFVVDTLDKRALATANHQMLGFTPHLLEKLADELARHLSFLYLEQIDLLTPKSAARFAECTLGRILVGLLNDKIHGESFVDDAITFIRTDEITQAEIKWETLQLTFGIPFRHERLKTKSGSKVTEDKLHRKTGYYLDVNGKKLYFSNDKDKINYDPHAPETYAKEVGYIKTDIIPLTMTPDDSTLKPKPQTKQVNPHKEQKHTQFLPEKLIENHLPTQELNKLLETNQKLTQENVDLKQQVSFLFMNVKDLGEQLQQLKSLLLGALSQDSPRGYSSQTYKPDVQDFLKNLMARCEAMNQQEKEHSTDAQKKSPKKSKTEKNPSYSPTQSITKLAGSSISETFAQVPKSSSPSTRKTSSVKPKETEEDKGAKVPDYSKLYGHR